MGRAYYTYTRDAGSPPPSRIREPLNEDRMTATIFDLAAERPSVLLLP